MGWAVVPSALTELLLRHERDYGGVPFLVTENGAAFDDTVSDGAVDDDRRLAYLEEHIDALERARAQGADVRGYYVWSFLDNFEWGVRQREAVRDRLCRLRHPGADPEAERALVPRPDRGRDGGE